LNNESTIVKISIDKLIPNRYQPRKYFNESSLQELANSIKNYGIINPILVRQKDDLYEIIAGERRFRAAKSIGLKEVPVIIKNTNEQQTAELALIENLARQDLTAIEAARAYEEIIKIGNHTQSEVATKLGVSQATIANKIRLLSLPIEIQDAVINKKISERHARALLSMKEPDKQLEMLERIISEKLTVKETEEIISMQEISEEDVKKEINDIMKTLNIKEEEKEDEKMNNGNFFPNYDNNMGQNNNISLNSLNNMNQNMAPIMQPEPENVMPTIEPMMNLNNQNMMNNNFDNIQPQPVLPHNEELLFTQPSPQPEPIIETPLFNQNINPASPINNFQEPAQPMDFRNVNLMSINQPLEPLQPISNPYTQINEPIIAEQPIQQEMPIEVQPMNISTSNNDFYQAPTPNDILYGPVNNQTVMEPVTENINNNDRVLELENLLNNNGFEYKKYSNEQKHCIIIEL